MADGHTDKSEDQSDLFRIRVVEERESKGKISDGKGTVYNEKGEQMMCVSSEVTVN